MNDQIKKAAEIINNGGIIIFPTDTAFGIGCRMDDERAIKKLFEIRKRPLTQATPVLVSGKEMAKKYLKPFSSRVETELMDKYWPGALTIVLESHTDLVPDLVRGGSANLGVRMPNNSLLLELIDLVGIPVLGPSANFHGEQTPYSLKDLNKNLIQMVDFVLEGECLYKSASTVIDCTNSPWKILRQGYININV